jgi:hypothetical protein
VLINFPTEIYGNYTHLSFLNKGWTKTLFRSDGDTDGGMAGAELPAGGSMQDLPALAQVLAVQA